MLVLFLGLAFPVTAGAAGDDFAKARPGRVFQFTADHGAHPGFKTEWWYYSGHLRSAAGESYGYQLTFFRVALRQPDPRAKSAWALNTVYFAHLALTDPARRTFLFREKAGRGALGLAGAAAGRLQVWVGDWRAEQEGEAFHLRAGEEGLALDLTLTPAKPPVLHGEGGFSRKAAKYGTASYYYSLTRLPTRGRLTLEGRTLEVTGESWMDHEFFTGALAPGQVGWDWFALRLADGSEVMLYLLRQAGGRPDAASSGTLIDPQGQARHLTLADFRVRSTATWKSPRTGATYPAAWQLDIPSAGYALTLTPTLADQELRTTVPAQVSYWEGEVRVQGQKNGQPLSGRGYVELTGYTGSLGGWF